jgi:hypothetical protein
MINPYVTLRTTITVICVCAQAGLEIKSATETNQIKITKIINFANRVIRLHRANASLGCNTELYNKQISMHTK